MFHDASEMLQLDYYIMFSSSVQLFTNIKKIKLDFVYKQVYAKSKERGENGEMENRRRSILR